MNSISKLLLGFAIFAMVAFQSDRLNDTALGMWMPSDKRSKIMIFKGTIGATKGKFYGKIKWLKEPNQY